MVGQGSAARCPLFINLLRTLRSVRKCRITAVLSFSSVIKVCVFEVADFYDAAFLHLLQRFIYNIKLYVIVGVVDGG